MAQAQTGSRRFQQVPSEVPKKSLRGSARASRLRLARLQHRNAEWVSNLYKAPQSRTYFFERQVNGRKVRIGLGRSFAEASRRAVEINTRIDRGEPVAHLKPKTITVGEFFEAAQKAARQHSPKTQASYRNRAAQFMAFLDECHPRLAALRDVTPTVAREYFEWRATQEIARNGKATDGPKSRPSKRTMRDDCITLRTMFRRAVAEGWIAGNPFNEIRFPKRTKSEQHTPYHLDAKQVEKLLRAAAEYDALTTVDGRPSTFRGMMRDMTHLYLLTGLRKNELVYLPWAHVDLEKEPHGAIHVRPFRLPVKLRIRIEEGRIERLNSIADSRHRCDPLFSTEQQLRSIVAKNYVDQERDRLMEVRPASWDSGVLTIETWVVWKQKATAGSVPLNKTAHDTLSRRRATVAESSPFVFPHPDGGPLRSDFWAQFKVILRMAGLPREIKVHDLRHTFAFEMLNRGALPQTLTYLMRHSDIRDTMVYAKCTPEMAARAIAALDGLGGSA